MPREMLRGMPLPPRGTDRLRTIPAYSFRLMTPWSGYALSLSDSIDLKSFPVSAHQETGRASEFLSCVTKVATRIMARKGDERWRQ